jgi:hypothetical protein
MMVTLYNSPLKGTWIHQVHVDLISGKKKLLKNLTPAYQGKGNEIMR